jgi:hypothetical protein
MVHILLYICTIGTATHYYIWFLTDKATAQVQILPRPFSKGIRAPVTSDHMTLCSAVGSLQILVTLMQNKVSYEHI